MVGMLYARHGCGALYQCGEGRAEKSDFGLQPTKAAPIADKGYC